MLSLYNYYVKTIKNDKNIKKYKFNKEQNLFFTL